MRAVIIGLLVWSGLVSTSVADDLPPCPASDFQTFRHVGNDEFEAHGGKDIAPVSEAFGSVKPYDFWIDYVIDETGHVACISAANADDSALTPTPERQAILDNVASLTFTPFLSNGQPTKVWAEHYVTELERPQTHIARPNGDLSTVRIQLENHGHRSPNKAFILVITGDGTVTYTLGDGEPDRLYGPQTYHIPPEQVAAMLDIAEKSDYWSLRDVYRSYRAGLPAIFAQNYYSRVAITVGSDSKDLRIYDGAGIQGTGISQDTYQLMYKLADIAKIGLWQNLTADTLAQLEQDGFDFTTEHGGDILLQVAADSRFPDSAVTDLIAKGAPTYHVTTNYFILPETSLLDAAIAGRRTVMVDDLIARGALLSDGKPDPHKLSRALARAVADAEPDMVAKFLTYHPELTLTTTVHDENDQASVISVPIITLVGEESGLDAHFEAKTPLPDLISVTQQLLDAGADINSQGSEESLLAKALSAGNMPFVRWLMSKGAVIDKSVWISYHDEDTTLFLLDNGAQVDSDIWVSIVDDAKHNNETKVIAWLKAHGKWPGG